MNTALKALALVALSTFVGASAHAQQSPVKVGVILPLSGGAGHQGQHVTQAIQAMAAIINESGGVMGIFMMSMWLTADPVPDRAPGGYRAHQLIMS